MVIRLSRSRFWLSRAGRYSSPSRNRHWRVTINAWQAKVLFEECARRVGRVRGGADTSSRLWCRCRCVWCVLAGGSGIVAGVSVTLVGGNSSAEDVAATCGTALLAFEPGAEAVKVEDVAARELLGRLVGAILWRVLGLALAWDHLLATDNARVVTHTLELLGRSIRVELVHVASCPAVADEVAATGH